MKESVPYLQNNDGAIDEFKIGSTYIKVGEYANKFYPTHHCIFPVKITALYIKPQIFKGKEQKQLRITVNNEYHGTIFTDYSSEKETEEMVVAILSALCTAIQLDIDDGTYKAGDF